MSGGRIKNIINLALDQLADQLDTGMSHGLKRYLAAMAKFHRYSAGNVLLILSQRPEATRVAGYQAWKRLRRQVKRGEKGIMILAPIMRRAAVQSTVEQREDEDTVVAFRTTYVFDISQTEGDDLPGPERVKGDPREYLNRLEYFILNRNIDVEYSDQLRGVDGISTGGQVTITASLSPAERFATLAHELAHEMLHWSNGKAKSRVVRETEAEAVAFVVCQAIGLEVGTASSDYIRIYNGDKNRLLDSLQRIQRTAAEIIGGIVNKEEQDLLTGTAQPGQTVAA